MKMCFIRRILPIKFIVKTKNQFADKYSHLKAKNMEPPPPTAAMQQQGSSAVNDEFFNILSDLKAYEQQTTSATPSTRCVLNYASANSNQHN